MDHERALISKVLADHDMVPVLTAKVTTAWFQDDTNALVFSWMTEYYLRYDEAPTRAALLQNYPMFKPTACNEPFEYYIDHLREQREYALLYDTAAQMGNALKGNDVAGAKALLNEGMIALSRELGQTTDVDLTQTIEERLLRYESWVDLPGGLRGLPTGFRTMDLATLGLQPRQLVTIVGLPKSGKSTLELIMSMAAHDYGVPVMFIGFEMSNEEQEARHDAFRAKVDYHKLMGGRLSSKETAQLQKAARTLKNRPPFTFIADPSGTATVSAIAGKIEEYKPDVVYIDGTYMMESEIPGVEPGSAQALTSITRALKRLAQRTDLPIVNTTQVLPGKFSRRQGITMDSIGYTSSFAQDSDVIFGVEQTDNPEINKLRIIAARNARRRDVLLHWSWETGEFEELEDDADTASGTGPDPV